MTKVKYINIIFNNQTNKQTRYRHQKILLVLEWRQLHVNYFCEFLQHHQHLNKVIQLL